MSEKRCSKCLVLKPHSSFHKDLRLKSGLKASCKECWKNQSSTYYSKNTESILRRNRENYHAGRKDLISDLGKICYCCGESTYEFLQVDHKDGSGSIHRQGSGRTALTTAQLRTHIEVLRVLCGSCHNAVSMFGKCPHQINVLGEIL